MLLSRVLKKHNFEIVILKNVPILYYIFVDNFFSNFNDSKNDLEEFLLVIIFIANDTMHRPLQRGHLSM